MKALITGIYGQDGSYLCEILQRNGYEVHGIIRSELSEHSKTIRDELNKNGIYPYIHITDIYDFDSLKKTIIDIKPDEIYHVAAVHYSAQDKKGLQEDNILNNILATYNILG